MLVVHSASGSEEGVLSKISGARALKPLSASVLVEITLKQALVFEVGVAFFLVVLVHHHIDSLIDSSMNREQEVKYQPDGTASLWNRVVVRQDGLTIASGVVQV